MVENVSAFTVKQLKVRLRSLGLPISGNKSVLIERIKNGTSSKAANVLTGVKDVDRLILHELDDIRLGAVRLSNKYAASLCDTLFWKQKVVKTYGDEVADAKSSQMTYGKQYHDLPTFVTKRGTMVDTRRWKAAKQERLDAFILYKDIWYDRRIHDILIMVIRKGYSDVIKGIILTYGKELINSRSFSFILYELSRKDYVEIIDIIYREYFLNTELLFYKDYVCSILEGNKNNNILEWAIKKQYFDRRNGVYVYYI